MKQLVKGGRNTGLARCY